MEGSKTICMAICENNRYDRTWTRFHRSFTIGTAGHGKPLELGKYDYGLWAYCNDLGLWEHVHDACPHNVRTVLPVVGVVKEPPISCICFMC